MMKCELVEENYTCREFIAECSDSVPANDNEKVVGCSLDCGRAKHKEQETEGEKPLGISVSK